MWGCVRLVWSGGCVWPAVDWAGGRSPPPPSFPVSSSVHPMQLPCTQPASRNRPLRLCLKQLASGSSRNGYKYQVWLFLSGQFLHRGRAAFPSSILVFCRMML